MVGTGILSNSMRSPSPDCYTTFWMMTIYIDTLHWSGITPIFYSITDLDLITEFDFLLYCERFPWNICNGNGMPTEDVYSSGHLVLSHFRTCKCSNVETNVSWTCLVFGFLNFEHPSVLLFLLFWVFELNYAKHQKGMDKRSKYRLVWRDVFFLVKYTISIENENEVFKILIFATHDLMTIFNERSKFQNDLMNILGDMAC